MDPRIRRLYWTALAVQHIGGVLQAGMVIYMLERESFAGTLIAVAFLLRLAHQEVPKPDAPTKDRT